jgi:hypothetical protein
MTPLSSMPLEAELAIKLSVLVPRLMVAVFVKVTFTPAALRVMICEFALSVVAPFQVLSLKRARMVPPASSVETAL